MKDESIYERCRSAGQLESVLLLGSVVGGIAAFFVFFKYGLLLSLSVFLLSLVAYGLGRLFDLVADILNTVGRVEENLKVLPASPPPEPPSPSGPSIPT